MEGERRTGTQQGRDTSQWGHQMGPGKQAVDVSSVGRSTFLCMIEVTRPIYGTCEWDCMNVQKSYKREISANRWVTFTQKRTSHVLYIGSYQWVLFLTQNFAPTETSPYLLSTLKEHCLAESHSSFGTLSGHNLCYIGGSLLILRRKALQVPSREGGISSQSPIIYWANILGDFPCTRHFDIVQQYKDKWSNVPAINTVYQGELVVPYMCRTKLEISAKGYRTSPGAQQRGINSSCEETKQTNGLQHILAGSG